MRPNPGGILTGDAIIDREKEIESIWRALENQSVLITSERRVGKTSILRKMQEHPRGDWVPILFIVEGKVHPIEFVEGLYEELRKENIVSAFRQLEQFYKKYVGGKGIGSWKLPQLRENWKTLLDSLIEDITNSGKKVVLMLDELPLMLAKFKKSPDIGPLGTMDFLDNLRELRNRYEASKKITFIFCGSVGIHLIIKDLKKNHGYNSDPTNNMKIVSVSGMDEEGALELCWKLAEGAPFQFAQRESVFAHICRSTDKLPFYIQHLFEYFYESGSNEIGKKLVDEGIDYLLNDAKDIGFFRHYLERIKTYYDPNLRTISLSVLDNACKKRGYWKETDIIDTITGGTDLDSESVKEVLDLLWSDHYLEREIKGGKRSYKFKYSILKTWWKTNRG